MTSEIEEAFTLNFRVDSFGSGSISFGRFESEALCWERRSSFSHNRYLEEVEKCSKPGSVTEKKAYFEAHFRKKRFPVLTSPECTDDKFIEEEISGMMCDDEEIDHLTASIHGSEHGLDNNKLSECEKESGIQMKENLDCEAAYINEGVSTVPPKNQQTSLPKKNSTSKPEHIKPRLVPRVSPGPSRRYTPVSSCKTEKKTSGDPHKRLLLHKTTKNEGVSETKGVDKINSGERKVRSRSRTIVEPQRSTSQKESARPYQSANRVKPAFGVSKPGTRQDISKSTRKEAVPGNIQARKQHAGTKLSSQTGIVQTTSTSVRTNSRASSSAQTSKVKASIGRKKEPQKERIERRSYASFNTSSSRGDRMAVGVVS